MSKILAAIAAFALLLTPARSMAGDKAGFGPKPTEPAPVAQHSVTIGEFMDEVMHPVMSISVDEVCACKDKTCVAAALDHISTRTVDAVKAWLDNAIEKKRALSDELLTLFKQVEGGSADEFRVAMTSRPWWPGISVRFGACTKDLK